MARYAFRPYVPVAQRRAQARREMDKLRKKGKAIEPVEIDGRAIARGFWGKGWCEHLESFSDFENRLPRGRTYVRNGSVCHLGIEAGRVEAIVSGSELYQVEIDITKLEAKTWKAVKQQCAGQIGSMLELLQGKLSEQVMAVVSDRERGLFPKPREIRFGCSCPDYATMCKHIAAVLYGVGSRLDGRPELLFTLRGVDPQELIASEIKLPQADTQTDNTLSEDQLSDVFGIELDGEASPPEKKNGRPRSSRKTAARKRASRRRASPTASSGAKGAGAALPQLRPTGRSVARLRKKMGYTVGRFAHELSVTPATVYRWEATSNRLRLQPTSLRALARLHQQAHRPRH